MEWRNARKGVVLVTVLLLTGVCAIVLGGVLGYVASATRMTSAHLGDDACRLAAQGEIELAKTAINSEFTAAVVNRFNNPGMNMNMYGTCAFDWFGTGDDTTLTRTIGAKNGLGTAVTLDDSVESGGCTVRVRVGRVYHPANKQWAEVTLVAEAVRMNPGGIESRQVVAETVRFAQSRSKVFDNAYFVNNYGWFQGSGGTANGDVRSNGDMYLDSRCKVNGLVYAAPNPELGVSGRVTNYGTMDSYSTYKGTTYGASNMARPLAVDPQTGDAVAGGYEAPQSVTTQDKINRVHDCDTEEVNPVEMPYIGDLTSENSDYRQWINELRALDSSLCKVTQGGNVIVDKYYDGVGPSGDATLADKGVLILEGTQSNPIVVNGPVVVESDVIIKGYVTGQGTIYSGRNIHIVGDITYVNPPSWSGKRSDESNSTKDMLGLMAKGNIVMGDYTDSTWLSSIRTYLTSQPYVQQYACDPTDDLIGYPSTFGGSYAATEKVTAMGTGSDASHAPGGWNPSTGQFGKVREVELATTHPETVTTYDRWGRPKTTTTMVHDKELRTVYDRKYYESVVKDDEISSRCSTITRIDAVLYNNHGIFGKLGKCSINGSLVCRNEGLQYTSNLYLNWDMRLYSGSSETVDNDKVGLAKASDCPPTTVDWRLLPLGVVDFDSTSSTPPEGA
ncbi:MAG: hypothetical protein IJG84_16330 [Kiritimatiellae bacterium]|nr:hypothetical protein [Kiritimatiellia bacterium]